MASSIKIKRSDTAGNPSTLGAGELAYSSLVGTDANGGDRLYIGTGTETAGNAVNHVVIGGKYFTDQITAATNANTVSTLVKRDASGNFSAGTITAALTGNAATATKWATQRYLTLSGDADASFVNIDGSANATATITFAATGVTAGTYGSATAIPVLVVDAKGRITGASTTSITVGNGALTLAMGAAGATNTSVTIGTGTGFTANIDSAVSYDIKVGPALTNLATLMTTATAGFIKRSGQDTYTVDTNTYLTSYTETDTLATVTGRGATTSTASTFSSGITVGGVGITYNGSTSGTTALKASAAAGTTTLTLPAATDTLVGKATTDTLTNKTISGASNTLSNIGNSSLTNSSITVGTTAISLGGSATTITGLTSVTSTAFVGTLSGNASSAGVLVTSRNINGVAFNGGSDITVTAAAGTLTGTTLNSTVVSSSLTSVGTIGTGVWQGTDVGVLYGGTGTSTGSITGTDALTFTAGGTNTNVNLVPNGTGTVDVASKRITSVATPSADTDAANKAYVDAVKTGLNVKDAARVATTAALTTTYSNGTSGVGATLTNANTQAALVLDGVTLAVNDRVLVKDQAAALQNGIYTVTNIGSVSTNWVLTRAIDFDNSIVGEVAGGDFVFVQEGTAQADNGYVVTTNGTITVGTSTINFVQFSGAGQITAGAGLTKTGNTIDAVGTANRITVAADSIDIASTYVGQNTITTLGTITTGTWNASVLSVPYGGTGLATITARAVIFGNGILPVGVTAASTIDGSFLRGDASGSPYFSNVIDGGTY